MITRPTPHYAGDTLPRTLAFQDATQAAIDLTGCTAIIGFSSANPAIPFSLGASIVATIPTPTNGQVVFTIPEGATSGAPPGIYNLGCAISFANGWLLTEYLELIQVIGTVA